MILMYSETQENWGATADKDIYGNQWEAIFCVQNM